MSHSPSLQFVLTTSTDGPITAHDAVSGAAVARFTGSRSPRNGFVLVGNTSFAASHISSATASASIHLYNWWSTTAFHHLPVPEPVAPLAVTDDGSYLFAGGVSGNVHVLSLPSGNVIRSVPAHKKPVSCFRISTDGSLLISGGDDGATVIFPILLLVDEQNNSTNTSTTPCDRFLAHTDSVTAISSCMGICNYTIVSSSLDCTCKIWSLSRRKPLRTVAFPCAIWGVAIDPTESQFFAAGSNGLIYQTALKVGSKQLASRAREPLAWEQNHGSAVVSVAVADKGRSLVSASEDGVIWIWDVESAKVRMVLTGEMRSISAMAVAGGVRNVKRCSREEEKGGGDGWSREFGLSGREMDRPIREVVEMEKLVREAEKVKGGAIDMLESAIAVYERLLELILKEAKRSSSSNNRAK